MNFFQDAQLVTTGSRHLNTLSDLGGLLFNGRILAYGSEVLDDWLVLPVQMRSFWGAKLRSEIWNLAKFCATEKEVRELLDSIRSGESARHAVYKFKHKILTRLGI